MRDENDCRTACTNEASCTFYVLNKALNGRNRFMCLLKRDKNNGTNGTTGPSRNVMALCDKMGKQQSTAPRRPQSAHSHKHTARQRLLVVQTSCADG